MLPMKMPTGHRPSTPRASHRVIAALAAAALHAGAHAQSIASTLDDLVQSQVDEQVESALADSLQETIEQQVESDVADEVNEQIETSVADGIEQQIEAGVADAVEQQIETGVAESVEQQIETGVTEAVEQQIETGIADTVEQQIDSSVTGIVEQQVELESTVEVVLDAGLGDALDDALDRGLPETGLEDVAGQPPDTADPIGGNAADQAANESSRRGGDAPAADDAARAERFIAAFDADGRTIERDVWIILVPPEHADRIDGWGFDIQARQALTALDRTLVRVTAPEDRDIAEAALELALDAPGTFVDYNHAYGAEADEVGEGAAAPPAAQAMPSGPLAIGIVDTAVAVAHEALRSAMIAQQDFVPFDAPRPSAHGTAVASILVGDSTSLQGRLPDARLYAAAVFFEDEAGEAIATTESLVEALEWLRAEAVPVVNMSLSGPPNVVLESALDIVTGAGTIVVAAVGNNGPAGEPLYPAAYERVVGVTAVDAKNRIYRYANRGRHVMFAAPGVDVKVAIDDGRYRAETGTSMAAPYAAAIIAGSLAAKDARPQDVLARLKATAIDLGEKAFDDVYGFGLISGEH